MLTGGLPFNGNTAWEWATQHMTAAPRPLETFPTSNRIPPGMKAAILRALEKDPNRRFPNVTEFFNAFSSSAPGEVAAGAAMPMVAPMYGQAQTQPGAPIAPAMTPPYQTGQHMYGTPPQGSHTYTPQPFSQMPTPPPQMMTPAPAPQKKGSALGIVFALLGVLVLLGGVGFWAFTNFKSGSTASAGNTTKVASTAPTDTAATTAATTAAPTDTAPLAPLALSAPKNTAAALVNTAPKATTAPTNTTAPTYTSQPTYTAQQPTAPTYTATAPTYTATAPTYPTYPPQNPNGVQPPECNAARIMQQQGQARQAAALAARCVRKGGQPPF
jgi:hypothetical protein